MKKILYTILMCFLIFEIMLAEDYTWSYPIDVDLVQITFDHGNSNSSIDIRKNGSNEISTPEYYPNYSRNEPAAYIVNQSARKIGVVFVLNQGTGVDNLYIGGNVVNGTGFGDFDYEWVDMAATTGNKLFTADGTIPSTVGKRSFQLAWRIIGVNDELIVNDIGSIAIGNSGYHTYYTLIGTPQSPMTEPWTDVLDYSCDWASGTSSISSAASDITDELYSCGFDYDTQSGGPRYGTWSSFNLTQFLSEIGESQYVNCLDMGKAVSIFSKAIGCNLNLSKCDDTYGFPVNCIDPIGSASATNNPFSSPLISNDGRYGGFSYHAYAQSSSNLCIWDATLKYDVDSDPDNVTGSDPGVGTTTTGYSWQLPTYTSESTYLGRLADDWTINYSGTPDPDRDKSFNIY